MLQLYYNRKESNCTLSRVPAQPLDFLLWPGYDGERLINMMNFISNIGTTEILVVGILLVLFFGGKKMTELARGLGESGKELKKAKRELDKAIQNEPLSEK